MIGTETNERMEHSWLEQGVFLRSPRRFSPMAARQYVKRKVNRDFGEPILDWFHVPCEQRSSRNPSRV